MFKLQIPRKEKKPSEETKKALTESLHSVVPLPVRSHISQDHQGGIERILMALKRLNS